MEIKMEKSKFHREKWIVTQKDETFDRGIFVRGVKSQQLCWTSGYNLKCFRSVGKK
jgi:hypothetical protein